MEKVIARKAHIIETKEKPLLSAAERAAARKMEKAEEKLKMGRLMDALKASGKSVEELLEDLKGEEKALGGMQERGDFRRDGKPER